jgi:AbrB family looped-hinge helix DNA binding protein
MASHDLDPTLVQLDPRGRITIPKSARSALDLDEGANLMLRAVGDRLELVPMTLVPRDQSWFYRDAVQARVSEASRDVEAGRTEEVDGVAGLERRLDALDAGDG